MGEALMLAAAVVFAVCVVASWGILVGIADRPHPGATATVTAITSTLICTTALSATLAALIGTIR